MIAGDAEALRRALAEDLEYVHSTGVVEGREELIASITSGGTRCTCPDQFADCFRNCVISSKGTGLLIR